MPITPKQAAELRPEVRQKRVQEVWDAIDVALAYTNPDEPARLNLRKMVQDETLIEEILAPYREHWDINDVFGFASVGFFEFYPKEQWK